MWLCNCKNVLPLFHDIYNSLQYLLIRSIKWLILTILQCLLLLTRVALLGVMAHSILTLRRLLGSSKTSIFRVRYRVRNATSVLVVGSSCCSRCIDILSV